MQRRTLHVLGEVCRQGEFVVQCVSMLSERSFTSIVGANAADPCRLTEFDDAKVSVVDDNSVLGLEGGGEGPVAYLLLYQQKRFD